MKTFMASVLGAVMAGLILFFAQNWWTDSQSASKQRIRFDRIASVELSKKDLQDLYEKSNDYQGTALEFYRVANVGNEDIADRSFSAPMSDILGFGSISNPNGNPRNVELKYDGKVVSVKYRLITTEAEHTFWAATRTSILGLDFSNDSKGVHVVSASEKMDDEDPFPWTYLGGIAVAIIAFLAGAVAGTETLTSQLKKKGVDVKDALKQPDVTP